MNSENQSENQQMEENEYEGPFPISFNELNSGFYKQGEGQQAILEYINNKKKQKNKFPKEYNPLMGPNPYVQNPNYPGGFFPQSFNTPHFNNFNPPVNNFNNKNDDIQQKNYDDKIKEFEDEAKGIFEDPDPKALEVFEINEEDENKNIKILFNNQSELNKTMIANNRQLYVQMKAIQWELKQMIESMRFSMAQMEEDNAKQNEKQQELIGNMQTKLDNFGRRLEGQNKIANDGIVGANGRIKELSEKIEKIESMNNKESIVPQNINPQQGLYDYNATQHNNGQPKINSRSTARVNSMD